MTKRNPLYVDEVRRGKVGDDHLRARRNRRKHQAVKVPETTLPETQPVREAAFSTAPRGFNQVRRRLENSETVPAETTPVETASPSGAAGCLDTSEDYLVVHAFATQRSNGVVRLGKVTPCGTTSDQLRARLCAYGWPDYLSTAVWGSLNAFVLPPAPGVWITRVRMKPSDGPAGWKFDHKCWDWHRAEEIDYTPLFDLSTLDLRLVPKVSHAVAADRLTQPKAADTVAGLLPMQAGRVHVRAFRGGARTFTLCGLHDENAQTSDPAHANCPTCTLLFTWRTHAATNGLNKSQRAMIAARLVARDRTVFPGPQIVDITQQAAANALEVSRRMVFDALELLQTGNTHLIAQVEARKIHGKRAVQLARDIKEKARKCP